MLLMRFFFFLAVLGLVLVLLPDFLPLAFAQSANDPFAGIDSETSSGFGVFKYLAYTVLFAVLILGMGMWVRGWGSTFLGWERAADWGWKLALGAGLAIAVLAFIILPVLPVLIRLGLL